MSDGIHNVKITVVTLGMDEELETVAETARRVMRLGDGVKPHISVGQINFVPK